jgi:Ca-activated chloride channel homolog
VVIEILCRPLLSSVLAVLATASVFAAQPSQSTQVYRFDFEAGDTLVAQNDYGRIRILPWDRSEVEVSVRVIAAEEAGLRNVSVVSRKVGDKIFVQAYFWEYSAESVYVDVSAPPDLSVIIWGANPAVEISGLKGFVRAQTLTGFISADNLSASTSLLSHDGNIQYTSAVQPLGDIRLESIHGSVTCRLAADLNLRGWLRAGRSASWNEELELVQGSLERQLGVGGPLLLATSLLGDVRVRLDSRPGGASAPFREPPARAVSDPASVEDSRAGAPDVQPRIDPSEPSSPAGYPSDRPRAESAGHVPAIDSAPLDGFSLRVSVDWVYVNASVRDRWTNRAVPNLTLSDFEVIEDGKPQRIEKFDSTNAPFSLLLLIDVSGSTRSFIDMIREASIEFTRLISPADRVALATFNSQTSLRQDFTNDRKRLADAIRRIRSGGGTAFYDALDISLNRYLRDVEGRKAIVVFTDGVDNRLTGDFGHGSVTTFRDLYRRVQETDTLIYTIFLNSEAEFGRGARRGRRQPGSVGGVLADIILGRGGGGGDPAYAQARKELELIAEQTGGRMYEPRAVHDLSPVYGEIADDLRVQYTLGYHSGDPSRDGRWRELEVRVKDRTDLVVRTRRGYYAGRE